MANNQRKMYVSDNSQLMVEWDWEANLALNIDPYSLSCKSNKKVMWKCHNGHNWLAVVANRSKGSGCPFCSGRYPIEGKSDLATTHPEIAIQWHPSKNGELTPQQVKAVSGKRVWWICEKGHEWQARIADRFSGYGCPYCAGRYPICGETDLATTNPSLAQEWHPTRNGNLSPDQVTAGSGKRVWWICKRNHEWNATIASRNSGRGCPYCSNKQVLYGYNDLATTNPTLARQWHPEKNGKLTPQQITDGSNKLVWWICEKGHEWKAEVIGRSSGRGCPTCALDTQTSFPEQAILFYARKVTQAIHRWTALGKEVDVYLPMLHAGIEYNGYWHKNRLAADKAKIQFFRKHNIRIITIKPSLVNSVNGDAIEHERGSHEKKSLQWALDALFDLLKLPSPTIDITRDEAAIYAQYISTEKENSFGKRHPQIAEQWHPTKNGRLLPEHITGSSGKRVWWLCEKGHEWQAAVSSRVKKHGCPYCSGLYPIYGETDFASVYPALVKEWNSSKNNPLLPSNVTAHSGRKVWWVCEKGHEWQATIASRAKGHGCPRCTGHVAVSGENDLATLYPHIANEWHPNKNGNLFPAQVTANSGKKVWWICERGHEWQAVISSRTNGKGCPYCSGRLVIPGHNDLATINPQLAKEWHPIKNESLLPQCVSAGSSKKVWWVCRNGHEWQAVIGNRHRFGYGCPECARGKSKNKK